MPSVGIVPAPTAPSVSAMPSSSAVSTVVVVVPAAAAVVLVVGGGPVVVVVGLGAHADLLLHRLGDVDEDLAGDLDALKKDVT